MILAKYEFWNRKLVKGKLKKKIFSIHLDRQLQTVWQVKNTIRPFPSDLRALLFMSWKVSDFELDVV